MEIIKLDPSKKAPEINLGKQGEYNVTSKQFDTSLFESTYGAGTLKVLHKRNGDSGYYEVALSNKVWSVALADTDKAGYGTYEARWYTNTGLAKALVGDTKVIKSAHESSVNYPTVIQGWVDRLIALLPSKQDKLTAGSGISIVNNVISATGGGGGGSSHTHANLSVLDGISSTKVTSWDSKADPSDIPTSAINANTSARHTHANKSVLDGITSTKVAEWDAKSTFSGDYNDLTNKPTIPEAVTDAHINDLIDAKIAPYETLADELLEVI